MNYWVFRNHKRQSDKIIQHLTKCGASVGFNLYARQVHNIQFAVGNDHFWVVREGRQWHISLATKQGKIQHIKLDEFDSKKFWIQLEAIVIVVFSRNV